MQAAIAAVHDAAASFAETDWGEILMLYQLLEQLAPDNPMLALNGIVAAAMVYGPARGLAMLAELERDPRLQGHYRVDAVRAHLLEMDGRVEEARAAYRRAASGTNSLAEREYLMGKVR